MGLAYACEIFLLNLKCNSSGGIFDQWMTSDDIADQDGYKFHDGANFEQENDNEFNAEKITTVGRLAQMKQNEMTATRMVLEDVGWTDKSPNGFEHLDKTLGIPEHMHNASAKLGISHSWS